MLEVSGLSVSYGRHRALEGVGLTVAKGEICVILGANGAGKSTLLKAIAGMVKADAGEVVMNGRSVTKLKAHRIVEEGIALVPEGRGIFGDLSVAENLQLGAFAQRARRDEHATLKTIYELFPRLAERKRQTARTMSGGEQQMVAIGRALMSRPDILMLDEPSLGLSPILTQELFRSLTAVAATGVGILLVEQNARQSLKIARRGYLIENGHVTGENSAEALRSDPAVIAAYLGGAAAKVARPTVHLPPSIRLPDTLAAMGRMAGDLASRAGAISQAFVRSVRGAETLPSAFVGRYDPKAGGDPWAPMAEGQTQSAPQTPSTPVVAADARWLASSSANLAVRASERLAQQVASARRAAPVPSAFVTQAKGEAEVSPSASLRPASVERRIAPSTLNGSHGLIGHNSAAAGLDDGAGETATPASAAGALDIADLAARAAAIQKRHVETQRRSASAGAAGPWASPVSRVERVPTDDDRADRSTPDRISIADLAARAEAVQKRHVATGRKALTGFTLPATALPVEPAAPGGTSGRDDTEPSRDKPKKAPKKGKKNKLDTTSARKGKTKR